jgi:hypothetical protein
VQTRRSLIKKGIFGGAILAIGGGTTFLLLRSGRDEAAPSEGLLLLSEHEYSVIDAVAHRMIGKAAGFPDVDEVRVAFRLDRLLARTDNTTQMEIRQLLNLFENAFTSFIFGWRTKPFTALSGEEQDRVLLEWRNSRIDLRRTGFIALRTLVMAAYYADPRTWLAVGYSGPPRAFHDPNAKVWRGDGPRPPGPGVFIE